MSKAGMLIAMMMVLTPIAPCADAQTRSAPATTPTATTPTATTPTATTPTAATTASTTASTTQPGHADPTTPKGALKSLAHALDAGDRGRVLELLSADTDDQRKWAEATAELAEATAALRRAASLGFGAQASRPLGVDVAATPEAIARIDGAQLAINGEKATLRSVNEEGPPLVLVRKGGTWRVPVSEFSRDVESADLHRAIGALSDEARLLRELAAEVSAGKYKTATDARQALDQRILQSAMPQLQPAAPAAPAAGTTKP